MTVSVQADLFDDLRTVTFIADSRGGEQPTGDPACLVIRAKESRPPELYIAWHRRLGEDGAVTMRVDSEPAEEGRWPLSGDREASFYPGSVTALLRRLAGARRLRARATPSGRPPVTVEFDLREFGRLVRRYRWVLGSGGP
jgi:hypothetical protein